MGTPREDLPPTFGDADLLIECYDRNGKRLWVRRDGGMSAERPRSLHLLPDHRALVIGGFDGTSFLAGQVIRIHGWTDVFLMSVQLPTQGDKN
jgi:hypothetical protein